MTYLQKAVRFNSLGDELAAALFLPKRQARCPVMIVCHGAGEFKENYFEMCRELADKNIGTLAIDMHGHGESAGERYHVRMEQWVADVRSGIEFLCGSPDVDKERIGAFGLSSGGTAILEAAIVDPRLRALVALDPTVRNSLPIPLAFFLRILIAAGHIKKAITSRDLRVSLVSLGKPNLASDPEVQEMLRADPRACAAFMSFPFPSAQEAFFVDTLERVSRITVPTLVLWGEDDKLDPPETGKMLFNALNCKKALHIIEGNGHVGHLDRNKQKVFELTAQWALENL